MMKNYNSAGSRDPIWTQVAYDPNNETPHTSRERLQSSPSYKHNDEVKVLVENGKLKAKGLSLYSAAVFIAGEMAGSGVLALPKAIVDTGWMGLFLLLIFCVTAGYSGTRLGACWDILEERFPEHRGRTRNPYSMIAYRAVGQRCSKLVSACIQFTLFGAGTVYLLLSSQIFQELLQPYFPNTTFCSWFLLLVVLMTPLMWLESPKEFSCVGIGAILTTATACVFYFTQMVMDGINGVVEVTHAVHGFCDFFLGFGVLLFAFGGASTFPTIQNDMENKNNFTKSAVSAFSVIIVLYFPVAAAGYLVYGEAVTSNLVIVLTKTKIVMFANILMAVHLILAFLIIINPVCQEIEEIFQVPRHFNWKRAFVRTLIIILMAIIGESIPQFGKILSLIGGSTITLLTFVFPPWFYMKLCDQENPLWPQRIIPTYLRIFLWELILVGIVGGSAATYSAIKAIFEPGSLSKACYWPK